MQLNSSDVQIHKENWQVVNTSKAPPSVQRKIAIHHYMVKSRQVQDLCTLISALSCV